MPIRLLELFGGIGACSAAFDRLGIPYTIADYVEVDKYAVKSYNAIHGTNFEPQDISKWDKDIEVDVIMHGSPCQDFSIAGFNKGGDKDSGTRSSLMYETIRIVEKLRPKYVIWENVKNLLGKQHRHNFDNYIQIMKDLGYDSYYKVLNAKDYGIPQNRERVFTVSIRGGGFYSFPDAFPLDKRLKDILETEVDEKYYMSDARIQHHIDRKERCKAEGKGFGLEFMEDTPGAYIKVRENNKKGFAEAYEGDSINVLYPGSTTRRGRVQNGMCGTITRHADCEQVVVTSDPKINVVGMLDIKDNDKNRRVYDPNGLGATLTTMQGGNQQPKILIPGLKVRRLTPLECWRLMGFTDEYYNRAAAVNSATQLYKQAGNSIVVNVLEAILKSLLTGTENKQITLFDLLGG